MRADRLLSILLLLQTRARVPAAELARRMEVSVRTVYRDVEALSTAGVPVYAERGRRGGIALLPGYRTDVSGLTADEARALFVLTAQGTHAALGLDGALGTALRKVMAALPAPHRPAAELTSRRVLVDPDRWLGGPRPEVDVAALLEAVLADRRLRLRYRPSGSPAPRRFTVDPYGLVVKAGIWYLVADHRAAPRLFRADRMAAVSTAAEPARRRPGVELAEVWEELRRRVEERPTPLTVRARVHRSRLDLFLRISGSSVAALPEGDGRAEGREWVPVELRYQELGAAHQLLQFGTRVVVDDPPEVRRLLARTAAEIAAGYGGDQEERAGAERAGAVSPAAGTTVPAPR
ncbi:helix-turn-helix transcriptional regulator [Streptomyces triticirhizae]|uniref:WYL domain-containing protein n=1 Tax=Streptomyces triticirhizae TaxID=2483353 RepID=A0A3M2LCM6_9ACTN|nr:WYL domain-containing protein [Streptomyces triticirhizae]RMI34480.1 WYL domain-containing protein [Streptomyces triticirhizae]